MALNNVSPCADLPRPATSTAEIDKPLASNACSIVLPAVVGSASFLGNLAEEGELEDAVLPLETTAAGRTLVTGTPAAFYSSRL